MIERAIIREAEQSFGVPEQIELTTDVDCWEFDMVASSMKKRRTDDVTFFILEGDQVVVIRKPMFPPSAYRAPSGGLRPGESLREGALREACEETGLRIELERYVLRVSACFRHSTCTGEHAPLPPEVANPDDPGCLRWWSHVFLARPVGDRTPLPRDTEEIAEARWVSLATLQGPIRDELLKTGWGLFRYRVALTDATLEQLGIEGWGQSSALV